MGASFRANRGAGRLTKLKAEMRNGASGDAGTQTVKFAQVANKFAGGELSSVQMPAVVRYMVDDRCRVDSERIREWAAGSE